MKIVCISSSTIPAPTAHSMQLMKVCQALTQLGNQVDLVVPGQVESPWKRLSGHYGISTKFNVQWLRSWRVLRRYEFSINAIRYALQKKADLIYTWLLPVAVIANLFNLPTVLELHDRITGIGAPWLFKLLIRSHGKNRLVVITRALSIKLEQAFGKSYNNINVIVAPNGVELERYRNLPSPIVARKQFGLMDRPTVVYTGGFYPGRGIELLHALASQQPQVQFVWAGGSQQSVNDWQVLLASEGIPNVSLPGFVDNERLPILQAAADILVMPFGKVVTGSSGGNSADICSPMKMFDYLASGRAILASDLPVLREVLNDRNAVLLPPDDQTAWGEALSRLLNNAQARRSLGRQARIDAEKYSWVDRETAILKGFIII